MLESTRQHNDGQNRHDAAKESNLPSAGLRRPAGFENCFFDDRAFGGLVSVEGFVDCCAGPVENGPPS
jgi:hypothetical protein